MLPEDTRVKPDIIWNVVDLPAPLEPKSAVMVLGLIVMDMSLHMVFLEMILETVSILSMARDVQGLVGVK